MASAVEQIDKRALIVSLVSCKAASSKSCCSFKIACRLAVVGSQRAVHMQVRLQTAPGTRGAEDSNEVGGLQQLKGWLLQACETLRERLAERVSWGFNVLDDCPC